MPIIKSAVKCMKQTRVKNARNAATKKSVKIATKEFIAKPSASSLSNAQSALDTAVKKNIIPKQRAAHKKAALAKIAKDAGVKLEAKKAAANPAAKKAAEKPAAAKAPAAKKAPAKPAAAKKPAAKKPAAKKATK